VASRLLVVRKPCSHSPGASAARQRSGSAAEMPAFEVPALAQEQEPVQAGAAQPAAVPASPQRTAAPIPAAVQMPCSDSLDELLRPRPFGQAARLPVSRLAHSSAMAAARQSSPVLPQMSKRPPAVAPRLWSLPAGSGPVAPIRAAAQKLCWDRPASSRPLVPVRARAQAPAARRRERASQWRP